MDNELRAKIWDLFNQEIQGGCCNDMVSILEGFVEDGGLTEDECWKNEVAIASLFDDNWFTCEGCGWTMPMADKGDDSWYCGDCADEDC